MEKSFRDFIEQLKKDNEFDRDRLTVILNTPGGSAETVEKMVNVIRFHYNEVYFVVPDYAMSAGTIFCMSGDKIFMDYSSSLGPIDPQVFNGKNWVPALGYLDKVEQLIEKSANNELTEAEFLILQKIDLAELRSYEMARDLTVSLLKQWLVINLKIGIHIVLMVILSHRKKSKKELKKLQGFWEIILYGNHMVVQLA